MKHWEIWKFPYPSADRSHWFVVLSPTAWCENPNSVVVNGLLCTTLRPPGRQLREHETRLDPADGLEWDTIVKCPHVHELPKARAVQCLGAVSSARRREIARRLAACLLEA